MNYEKIYSGFYSKYYSKTEQIIKSFFLKRLSEKRTFNYASNEICENLKHLLISKYNLHNNQNLKNIHQIFKKRHVFYSAEETQYIFKNEIKTDFEKINYEELPENYTFIKLIKEIAITDILEEILRLMSINNRLLEMFYKLNDFKEFEIRDHKGLYLENYPIYLKLENKLYPSKTTNDNEMFFDIEESNDSSLEIKTQSLPLAIAMLNEVGFFELEKIKNLSPINLAKIIAIIQVKDPNCPKINRHISGNIRVLNPDSKEDATRYTSYKSSGKAKTLLNQIKQGN